MNATLETRSTSDIDSMIRVRVEGREAGWSRPTGFVGDEQIVNSAQYAVLLRAGVDVGEDFITAGDTDPVSAIAALHFHRPGRTELIQCPERILDGLGLFGE